MAAYATYLFGLSKIAMSLCLVLGPS
jgi:hypothetical protein